MKRTTLTTRAIRTAAVIVALMPALAHGQTAAEMHAGFEQYWKDQITYLKKIAADNDNHQAAADVNQMKTAMLPRLDKQLQTTEQWKKTHTKAEIDAEEKWSENNGLQKAVAEQQTSIMMASARQGGEYAAAFRDYMKEMVGIAKKYRK